MTREIAVLGSGMAAMGAAHRLRRAGVNPVVYDARSHYGGHTASYVNDGFVFDEGPHISFTKDPRIQQLFADNVDGAFEIIHARVNNYWRGQWIKHPAQCNLHGLPVELNVKIIAEMVAAQHRDIGSIRNYEEWLVASYGRPFAETFPMQYGRKYHTTEAANMSTDWLGPRLYRPSIEEVLAGALSPSTPDVHYVSEFRYPSHGGFVSFLRPFTTGLDLRLNHRVTALDPRGALADVRRWSHSGVRASRLVDSTARTRPADGRCTAGGRGRQRPASPVQPASSSMSDSIGVISRIGIGPTFTTTTSASVA